MDKQPLVCICVPNYNNEKTISETLDSIVNQTYKNIIIKIFDNASTDDSMKILKEYESKYSNIQVFQNETNIGGEANFTKCVENMEGEYGAIYHADDVYMPTIVEEEVKKLKANNISAVFTNAYQIDELGQEVGKQFYPTEFINEKFITLNFYELLKLTLKYGNFLTFPSCMAQTNIFMNSIKSWNSKDYKTSADLDVWFRFAKEKDIGIINKHLMKYRLSKSSFSYNRAKKMFHRHDMFLVLDKYINEVENSMENKQSYDLLILKDNSEIIFSKLMNQDYDFDQYHLDVFNKNNFINAITNKRLYKYYLFAILLKLVIMLGMEKNTSVLNSLYKIRFQK